MPRGRPGLFTAALLFTAAALGVFALPSLPPPLWLLPAVLPALLPWRWRSCYAIALLGALLSFHRASVLLDDRWPLEQSDAELEVQGEVASLPERHTLPPEPQDDDESAAAAPVTAYDWRFLFRPDRPAREAGMPSLVRVSWYRGTQTVQGGQCWRLRLRLRAPHGNLTPGGFDYEAWLFEQGIGATATVRTATPCSASGYSLLALRQTIAGRLQQWLPQQAALGMVLGLVVGDRGLLTPADWDVFRITGTSHLMAIAGLHIGMLAAAVFFLLRWNWSLFPALCLRLPAQKAAALAAALAASGYALLSGFEPPAQRALLMLLAGFFSLWLERPALLPRALVLAWLAIVAANPAALLSPGLWLSFGAVAAIFLVARGRVQPLPGWRAFLGVQPALSLALLPLSFLFFQGGGWIGPLANLVVVPAFTVLLPLLLFATAAAWLVPAAGLPLLQAVAAAIGWIRAALGWAAANAPAAWVAASPQPGALALAALGAVLLLLPRGVPLRRLAVLCLLPLLLAPDLAPRQGFSLAALDVGQGLAVVVRTRTHALLFDAGPAFADRSDSGRSEVVPYLLGQGLRHLDLMVISHADIDHRGGAPAVRAAIDVRREIGALSATPCVVGEHWRWDGVDFDILNSPAAAAGDRHARNNGACVLRVAVGAHAALLPADIEAAAEQRLLQTGAVLRSDVLLAPHHGSLTSSSAGFVAAVAPAVVIYPSGWHNRFRFPRADVVERYRHAGAQAFMTGVDGTLRLEVGSAGLGPVEAWRSAHPRLWRQPAEAIPADQR
jgi:competence protein ComEC